MTVDELRERLCDTLSNFHRVRVAVSYLVRDHGALTQRALRVRYESLPVPREMPSAFGEGDTLGSALVAIDRYARERLAHDAFLAMIAALESFLNDYLRANGRRYGGPFGGLVSEAAQALTLPETDAALEDMREVVRRRNCFIHDHGAPSEEYWRAAVKVAARYPTVIPARGVAVLPCDGAYLAHVVDVFVRYAKRL